MDLYNKYDILYCMRTLFILFMVCIFVAGSLLASFAMHSSVNMNHPSCVASILNGVACPQGSFWNYFLFHFSALRKMGTFIINEVYSLFLFIFLSLAFSIIYFNFTFKENSTLIFSKIVAKLKFIFAANNIPLKLFYRWLSILQKQEDALI